MKRQRSTVGVRGESSLESTHVRERQSVRSGREKPERGRKNPRKESASSRQKSGPESELRKPMASVKLVKVPARHTSAWKPLTSSVKRYLTAVIDEAEQKVLTQKQSEKQASKQHLNHLRESFLARCLTLRGPNTDLTDLKNVKKLCSQRRQEYAESRDTLDTLQSELDKMVERLEKNHKEIDQLTESVDRLRNSPGDTTCPWLQKPDLGALDIPELPKSSLEEVTLQERLGRIPNQDLLFVGHREALESSESQNFLNFLEFAHERAACVQESVPQPSAASPDRLG
uniref:Centromere protein Q n=1 Tax=Callorhinchus milii TaxID=7868 RepID=V9L677_CALMI